MGSSSFNNNEDMKTFGRSMGYDPDWMKKAERATGDHLVEAGVKLGFWSRLRRWWFGW